MKMNDDKIARLIRALREWGGKNTIHPHSGTWMLDAADALELLSASKPDYSQCCDTSAFCSSVRRCTAKDAAAPSPAQSELEAFEAWVEREWDVVVRDSTTYKVQLAAWNARAALQADPAADAPLAVMREAFRVTETEGHPDPDKQRFHMRFTFRSMEELHAADDQWRAFASLLPVAAPQPAADAPGMAEPSDDDIEAMCAEHGLGPNVGKLVVKDALKRWGAQPAQTGMAEPVATVESWTNGSYHRNYKLTWHKDVGAGAKLYTVAQPVEQTRALTDDEIEFIAMKVYEECTIEDSLGRQIPLTAKEIRKVMQICSASAHTLDKTKGE
jgi:hypothetical protein